VTPKHPKVGPICQPTLFEMEKLEPAKERTGKLEIDRPFSLASIFLGTSSFTATGWEGSFYPQGMQSRDFLSYYATQFATVEVDSTFYGCPSARTVNNWAARTPEDFTFCVKIPKVVTHEKALVDCDSEFEEFVKTMDILGPKLGPMVFQFPLFDRWKFPKQDSFLNVLIPFLKKLPIDHKFVLHLKSSFRLSRRSEDGNPAWFTAPVDKELKYCQVVLAILTSSAIRA
jgi:uncharacterized protein YecE (DUF72 family)